MAPFCQLILYSHPGKFVNFADIAKLFHRFCLINIVTMCTDRTFPGQVMLPIQSPTVFCSWPYKRPTSERAFRSALSGCPPYLGGNMNFSVNRNLHYGLYLKPSTVYLSNVGLCAAFDGHFRHKNRYLSGAATDAIHQHGRRLSDY